jgi:hypothetical protein
LPIRLRGPVISCFANHELLNINALILISFRRARRVLSGSARSGRPSR